MIRINLNSPKGNYFEILCVIYDALRPYYPCEFIERWLSEVTGERDYEEMLEQLQKEWKEKFEDTVGKLEFYKSKEYEM